MPLVNRAGLKNVFVQACEPGEWNQGCVWSDTDNASLFKNVCGTATEIGGCVVSCSTVMAYCQTAGNYCSPCSAASPDSEPTSVTVMDNLASCSAGVVNMRSGSDENVVETAATACSLLIGNIPKSITVPLKKTGSPPGCITAEIVDTVCGAVRATFGTLTAACLTGCLVERTFTNNCLAFTITENDGIGIQYNCGCASNTVGISRTTQTFDGTDSVKGCSQNGTCYSECACADTHMRVTGCVLSSPANAVDCCDCTSWVSSSVANPEITIDIGAVSFVSEIMLRKGALDDTTTYEIRASQCCPPGACDVIRTVTAACLTDDTDRFVRFNVIQARFIMIRGIDACASISEWNNIKVDENTVCQIATGSGRLCISTTDTSLGLCGS